MSLQQSAHPTNFCRGIPHLKSFRLTSQRKLDVEPGEVGPQNDSAKAALVDRIVQLDLRSCAQTCPSLTLNTLTSLSLNVSLRQPYGDFSSMLRAMGSLRSLALVDSLPWSLPGDPPGLMGQSSAGDARIKVPSFLDSLANWDDRSIYPLSLPSTLCELMVHDHGFRCIQFFAAIDCQLSKLEIQCITDGFDPVPLFQDASRLLLPMPGFSLRELVVRSESDMLLVQCSRSALSHSDRHMMGRIVQPTLSVVLDFNGESPSLLVYDKIIAMAVKSLPLTEVRHVYVDFHIDFEVVWFRGFFPCLRDLQNITLDRHAIDGFLQTHLLMASKDTFVEAIPFTSLQSVFADWDARWPQVWGDVDNILRYLNAGGVYPLLFNLGKYAEGFVEGDLAVCEADSSCVWSGLDCLLVCQ